MWVSRENQAFCEQGFHSCCLTEVTRADFSEKILWLPRPMESSPALPEAHVHWNSLPPPTSRLPAGGKAVNTAPVPGQTPHDESDRRTEPRSSVSDLVNSLTSEMLMVRRAGDGLWGDQKQAAQSETGPQSRHDGFVD